MENKSIVIIKKSGGHVEGSWQIMGENGIYLHEAESFSNEETIGHGSKIFVPYSNVQEMIIE